jgi:hypothetical protein
MEFLRKLTENNDGLNEKKKKSAVQIPSGIFFYFSTNAADGSTHDDFTYIRILSDFFSD